MNIQESSYIEEKKALYCLEHLIRVSLNDMLFNCKQPRSQKTIQCVIKKIVISKKDGVYIIGNIVNDEGRHNKNKTAEDKIEIVKNSYFENNPLLFDKLTRYIVHRPRMLIIPADFEVNGETITEKKVMVLKQVENKNLDEVIYEILSLYDENSEFMKSTFDKAKSFDSREKIYQKRTIQGRFTDVTFFNAITLALSGYTRGMIKDGVIYSWQIRNNTSIIQPISPPSFNIIGYENGPVEDKVDPEKFGCPVKSIPFDGSVTYIELANILGDQGLYVKYYDIINKIKEKHCGIVYLKNTLPEEIISTFYPCINPITSNNGVINNTIIGGYITDAGLDIQYANPDLEIIPFKYGNIKDKGTDFILNELGVTENSASFYIIPTGLQLPVDVLLAMSNHSLVYMCSEFGNLSGITTQLYSIGANVVNSLIERLIFAGSLISDEGIFIHRYIKHLMKNNDLATLSEIPLAISKKDVMGNDLRFSDMLNQIISYEENLNKVVITNKIQVMKNDKLYASNVTFDKLTYGEMLYLYMTLSDFDITYDMETKGRSSRIIRYNVETDDGKIYQLPFKLMITEMRNVKDQPPLQFILEPVISGITESVLKIGSMFGHRGINLICGEPGSGKRLTIQGICRALPNKGRVLVLDSEFSIVKEFFQDESLNTGINLTISRSTNIPKLKTIIQDKPEVLIVFKINNYPKEIINLIFKNYPLTQNLIIGYDGMFTDFLEELPHKAIEIVINHLGVATNQLRLTDRNGKSMYIYETISKEMINRLTVDRASKASKNFIQTIYKYLKDSPDGLSRQIDEIKRSNLISDETMIEAKDTIKRTYSDI